MKKLVFLSVLGVGTLLFSAFSGSLLKSTLSKPVLPNPALHIPFFATFDTDSFYCDPAEAKHQGKVHNRFNTLHMKEKGPDNIIVHFKSKKFKGKNGKDENNYVHFDALLGDGKTGSREDTHLTLTWKEKKYHIKDNFCKFNITSLTWDADKVHFTFSADFEAKLTAGGPDTTVHTFKGKIVEELVKSKAPATAGQK